MYTSPPLDELEAPELEAPELEAPELEAPELEAPELEPPELEPPEDDVPETPVPVEPPQATSVPTSVIPASTQASERVMWRDSQQRACLHECRRITAVFAVSARAGRATLCQSVRRP